MAATSTRTLQAADFFLRDHRLRGTPVLPAAATIELARAALTADGDEGCRVRLRWLVWPRPLRVAAGERDVRIALRPGPADGVRFELSAPGESGGTVVYCRGEAALVAGDPAPQAGCDLAALRAAGHHTPDVDAFYAGFAAAGLDYGPAHRTVTALWMSGETLLAELTLPAAFRHTLDDFVVHPSLLDGAFQAVQALTPAAAPGVHLPFAVDEVTIAARCTPRMWAVVRRGRGAGLADVTLCDAQGEVAVRVAGYATRRLAGPGPG